MDPKPCTVCGNPTRSKYGICQKTNACCNALEKTKYAVDPVTRARYQATYYEKHKDEKRKSRQAREVSVIAQPSDVCAICAKPESAVNPSNGKPTRLSRDHNHETGQWRDFLCRSCNALVGMCKEDVNILASAIRYLEKWNG